MFRGLWLTVAVEIPVSFFLIFLLSFQSCLMFRELWLTVAAEIPTPFYLILLSSFQSCLMFRELWLIPGGSGNSSAFLPHLSTQLSKLADV